MKLARRRERGVDQRLRHPVAGQVEEPDGLAGASDLLRHGLERPRLRAERGSGVDQGNRLGRLDVLDRQGLEDVHPGASILTGRDRNATPGVEASRF